MGNPRERETHLLIQMAIIFCAAVAGEVISGLLPVTIPGSILAMALLLGLLAFGVVKPRQIQSAGGFLLGNMALFFVPSAINIMAQYETLKPYLAAFLLICVLTTVLTFLVTYWVTALLTRWSGGRGKRDV